MLHNSENCVVDEKNDDAYHKNSGKQVQMENIQTQKLFFFWSFFPFFIFSLLDIPCKILLLYA